MNSAVLYRLSAALLVLFAGGHTIGFRRVDPRWGIDAVVSGMQTIRFDVQGMSRSYWGFYVGFGLFVTVLLLFAAVLAWQLGGLPAEVLRAMPLLTWGFALAFIAVTYLSWRYFFPAPVIFSAIIALCLVVAAWLSGRA
ncbi:MAG TPA: hypothetical protein VIV56_07555 [Gemmatimonadales bacterium]